MAPPAQLHVERGGRVTWLRGGVGELWRLERGAEGWRATRSSVPAGSWLASDERGAAQVAAPDEVGGDVTAWLRHPRGAVDVVGVRDALEVRERDRAPRRYPIAVAALLLSPDLRRVYVVSSSGAIFVVPAAPGGAPAPLDVELRGALSAVRGAALAPAGLVLLADDAVVGVNLRTKQATRLFACAPAPNDEVAIAVDHRGELYLASSGGLWVRRSDGEELARWLLPES
ncbi:MAG: hypothetical protein R3B48_12125 [Kofleriaceae bacterium]